MAHDYAARRRQLFDRLPKSVMTVILTPSETLRYFSGLVMHSSERPTVLVFTRDDDPAAVAPQLEIGRVRDALPNTTFYTYKDTSSPGAAARESFKDLQTNHDISQPIGVEFRSTRLVETQLFTSFDPREFYDLEIAVTTLRGRKEDAELDSMRRAAEITDDVLAATFEKIEPGMTERDIEHLLTTNALESDVGTLGTLIVTAGARTALPHTNTSDTEIRDGDLLMIDFGVTVNGYHSDITRTVAVGDPDDELIEIYNIVQTAAQEARETVSPGVACQKIDRVARAHIKDAGYGEQFTHRVGHGLGLEGHEPPYLVEGNTEELMPGMVVTVEPGVYIDGLGGVRVEDDVVCTENGHESLTASPRDLRVL